MSYRSTTIECMHESVLKPVPGKAELTALIRALTEAEPACDDVVHLERIRLLEQLNAAASAAQARQAALPPYRVAHPLLMWCPGE